MVRRLNGDGWMQPCQRSVKYFAETAHLRLDDPFGHVHVPACLDGVIMQPVWARHAVYQQIRIAIDHGERSTHSYRCHTLSKLFW